MTIDNRRLDELIEESQDLQSDALRGMKATLPACAELREERRGQEANTDEIDRFNTNRRKLLKKMGIGAGGVASRSLFAGGFGSLVAALVATPARADTALDIQILQTAASLENLAVATYGTALGLPFIANGNPTVKKFAQTTMSQHDEHAKAFNAQAQALGGQAQNQPNPTFLDVVNKAKPTLTAPGAVVNLAAQLEEVASDTYLTNLTQFEDRRSKEIMGSVLGVEVQHLATLRAVGALLQAGDENLVAIPTKVAQLPAAAGSAPFKDGAFLQASKQTVAEPMSGAVK